MIGEPKRTFRRDHSGDLVSDALVMPILLLVVFGMLNMFIFAMAGLNAINAAAHGARRGGLSQADKMIVAYNSTVDKLDQIPVGTYTVNVSCDPDCDPGGTLIVTVNYQVANIIGGLVAIVSRDNGPGLLGPTLSGNTVSMYRSEGW